MGKPDYSLVALGAGDVMIQVSNVSIAKNGPQIQVDFFQHSRAHPIGVLSTEEEVRVRTDWKHLCCIGSNSVASLDVLIEEVTKARDKLRAFTEEDSNDKG